MPDDEYYTNPAGLFGWFHGVPVGLPFTCKKNDFFLCPVQPPDQAFPHSPDG
jgi:hypothetical protein